MRNRTFYLFLILIALAGCGQKGPLYLPAEPEQNPNQPKD
ncbi:LPS translocon maturation chaperone LptM [Algibacillus agarilyticus]|nr:lipoprotein [Algibacillus agarilyticus]